MQLGIAIVINYREVHLPWTDVSAAAVASWSTRTMSDGLFRDPGGGGWSGNSLWWSVACGHGGNGTR